MGRKLHWIGGIITVLYIGFMSFMIAGRLSELRELPLNSLGDFLAGAFGPVAFLWLVLGFLQQGEELRQGTQALLLQAEELKNSVAQQSIMAEAATEQIKSQQIALQLQLAEKEKEHQPLFEFITGARSGGPAGNVRTSISFSNVGNEVRHVNAVFDPPIGAQAGDSINVMSRGGGYSFSFEFPWPQDVVQGALLIRYMRLDGSRWLEVFNYEIRPDSPFVSVQRPIGGVPSRI